MDKLKKLLDVRWSVDDGRFHFIMFVNERMVIERQPGLQWIHTGSKKLNAIIAWLGGWR